METIAPVVKRRRKPSRKLFVQLLAESNNRCHYCGIKVLDPHSVLHESTYEGRPIMHIAFKRFTPHVILEVHPGYDNINYTEGEIFEVRLPDDVNIATADHKIPYALGGDSNRENLIICCFPCNAQKGMYATYETFIAKKQGVDSE